MQHDVRDAFLMESARYLRDVYLVRLETALKTLPRGDLSWKPHAESLSFETILRHLEGLTFPEVARRMGRTVDSVKKQWPRALASLRRLLEGPKP